MARLAAEEQWLCFGQNLGIAAHVFRLGGIYGPGRRLEILTNAARRSVDRDENVDDHFQGKKFNMSAIFMINSAVDTILKQQPMSKRQKGRLLKDYTSRVHVADICQALQASILNPSAG